MNLKSIYCASENRWLTKKTKGHETCALYRLTKFTLKDSTLVIELDADNNIS